MSESYQDDGDLNWAGLLVFQDDNTGDEVLELHGTVSSMDFQSVTIAVWSGLIDAAKETASFFRRDRCRLACCSDAEKLRQSRDDTLQEQIIEEALTVLFNRILIYSTYEPYTSFLLSQSEFLIRYSANSPTKRDQTMRSHLRNMNSSNADLLQNVSYGGIRGSTPLLYDVGGPRARHYAPNAGVGAGIATLLDIGIKAAFGRLRLVAETSC